MTINKSEQSRQRNANHISMQTVGRHSEVTLISDKEAILNVTGWNDWNGLLNVTFSVIRTAKGVRFHNKKIKRLVPYNCGICY